MRARALLASLLSLVLLLAVLGPEGQRPAHAPEPALTGLSAPDAVLAAPERAAVTRTVDARDDGPDAGTPPEASAGARAAVRPIPQPTGHRAPEGRRSPASARGPPASIA
jgi:hypothetical protein